MNGQLTGRYSKGVFSALAVCPSPQSETFNFDNGVAFLLYDRRGEMPEPFELIGIEKGIHCGTRTGGRFNLDANLFKPEAVDFTSLIFRTPTAERLVLTQKSCYGWRRPYTASPSIIY